MVEDGEGCGTGPFSSLDGGMLFSGPSASARVGWSFLRVKSRMLVVEKCD